jgi:hypothetical protein
MDLAALTNSDRASHPHTNAKGKATDFGKRYAINERAISKSAVVEVIFHSIVPRFFLAPL